MKKNIINKILISISILFTLQNYLYAKETLQDINLAEVNLKDIQIPSNKKEKTKEDYEKKDDLLNPTVQTYEKSDIKKTDGLQIDNTVGVNKETKSIDKVKVNIGTNF